jgi:hypothetical protein
MESDVSSPSVSGASPSVRRTTVSTALPAIRIVYGDLGTSPQTYQTIISSVGGMRRRQCPWACPL